MYLFGIPNVHIPSYRSAKLQIIHHNMDRSFKSTKISSFFQVLSASGGQIIAVQNPALSMSGALPMRTSPSSPTSAPSGRSVGDSNATTTNLVNLLNLSRRTGVHHVAGNGRDNNAKKQASTIVHSDEDEMTFKQEPASPPPSSTTTATASDPRATASPPPPSTNGKN